MSIKSLLEQLKKCKDSTSTEARAIRRKLREAGHFVSGKKAKGAKSSQKNKKSKREKSLADDNED